MNKKSLSLIILFCLIIMTGCGRAPKPAMKPFRLMLDCQANPNHIPLFVGIACGYFEEEGISLEMVQPTLDDPLQHLESGQAEFTISYLPRILRATAKGHDFLVVGKLIDKPLNGFVCLSDSGIKSVEDFNGCLLGYDFAHCTTSLLHVLLNAKDIEVASRINTGDQAVSDLMHRGIDVIYGALKNIETVQIEQAGMKAHFFSVTDFGMPDYEEYIVVAKGSLRLQPHVAEKFQTALQKSIDFCQKDPLVAFNMYVEANPEKSPKSLLWEKKSWHLTLALLAESQTFNKQKVMVLNQWLKENGLLSRTFKLGRHFHSLQKQDSSLGQMEDKITIAPK